MDTPRAKNKLMDYLAIRVHSEKELREKLGNRFPAEEIDQAIQFAKEKKWLPDSDDANLALAMETANALGRKGRGIHYINQYLEQKGLPEITTDSGTELEKAQSLVENKYSDLSQMDDSQRAKVARFLLSRGFDEDVVEKVINER